uniref:Di- and tricarboxylate transporter n=1 Tax=Candidatus Kentrum sp. TC TaxID=2126339 RepID=A0A450ZCF8_9GAMM|nr:MAG: Di- and tricarboxylate transporter [Candidatus Kentron sp. TC]VFK37708.1 MAG: Di- and tricarboxylate transporter [Candidatus Kentron sp. TC]VFK51490.1 MAG: Di- and tricarboxylate transporter [Candidatus Kentron sp. TC]
MKFDSEMKKRLIGAVIFLAIGLFLGFQTPDAAPEIPWVMGILLLTIYLFAFEVVSVDVAAISIMVLLGLTYLIGPLFGLAGPLVDPRHLFDGFASNAVISIIAVIIIGAGLDKTGVMSNVASFILKIGGAREARIIPVISSTVGVISSFMQNVGAAALFLPVVGRISARTGLPMSRLLMPMGFCAILGGTITMVGSSPLILLNDLIKNSNVALAEQGLQQMETFSLFSVTPIGLALVATGIIYFVIAGRFVLPSVKSKGESPNSTDNYFEEMYDLKGEIHELLVRKGSTLIGERIGDVEQMYNIPSILGIDDNEQLRLAPPADIAISESSVLAVKGPKDQISEFVERFGLEQRVSLDRFAEPLNPTRAGIAEIVIPARSHLVGKALSDIRMRRTYGLNVMTVYRDNEAIRGILRNLVLQSGDTLVAHSSWNDLAALTKDRDFVVVTDFPHEETRPQKVLPALICFGIALFMVLFTDIRLSIALLTGALGMVLTGVLDIEEAYKSVSWKTVFLLASLIPLGLAVETSGTAKWIADEVLHILEGVPIWVLQAAIAVLATFFTLVMSNVGATVLLVPLAVNIAIGAGANPAIFALTVAIATSNSFLIPTHQVNALIMGPGGYRVPDYMRAGGIMTMLFLVVMMIMMNLVF